jgi:hypothetical protein
MTHNNELTRDDMREIHRLQDHWIVHTPGDQAVALEDWATRAEDAREYAAHACGQAMQDFGHSGR